MKKRVRAVVCFKYASGACYSLTLPAGSCTQQDEGQKTRSTRRAAHTTKKLNNFTGRKTTSCTTDDDARNSTYDVLLYVFGKPKHTRMLPLCVLGAVLHLIALKKGIRWSVSCSSTRRKALLTAAHMQIHFVL